MITFKMKLLLLASIFGFVIHVVCGFSSSSNNNIVVPPSVNVVAKTTMRTPTTTIMHFSSTTTPSLAKRRIKQQPTTFPSLPLLAFPSTSLFSSSSNTPNSDDDNNNDDLLSVNEDEIKENMKKRAYYKRLRSNLREATGVSITKIRVGLRKTTGFSLRTSLAIIRKTWRVSTGISLTAFYTSCRAIHALAWLTTCRAVNSVWHFIIGLFPLPIRYFFQPIMALIYLPLNIVSSLTVSQQTRLERDQFMENQMEFYRDSVKKARSYRSNWPIDVNDETGEFIHVVNNINGDDDTSYNQDNFDISDAIMKSVHLVRSIEYEKTGVPQP